MKGLEMYSKKLSLQEIATKVVCIYGINSNGERFLKVCKSLGIEDVYFVVSDDKSIPFRFMNGIMVLHLSEAIAIKSSCVFVLSLNEKYHDEVSQNIKKLYPGAIIFSGTEWENFVGRMKPA